MGVLDALAYGIPVITTPVGGVEQVLHHGKDCLIFDTYNIDALANALEQMMRDECLRTAMVHEADKLVNTCFNIQQVNSEIGDKYKEILCRNYQKTNIVQAVLPAKMRADMRLYQWCLRIACHFLR